MSERGSISLPARPPALPGFPSNPLPIPFEIFEGLNTHVPRPVIKDTEMSICDNWIGWGPGYLRTLWDRGPVILNSQTPIVWFGWGNIVDQPIMAVLLADGRLVGYNQNSGLTTLIAPAGTVQNPSSIFGFSQWGSQYLLFSSAQTNGYWLWNGTTLFTAGGLSPTVTITNAGLNYTSQPNITVSTTGGGAGATFSATITNGTLDNIKVVQPGSGFQVNDFVALTITGGGSDDMAQATVSIGTGGAVSGVQVISGGSRYSANSFATVSGGGGSGASVALQAQNGVITGITIVNGGLGYTSIPTITVTDPSGSGSGFSGTVEISGGQIISPVIVSGGSNYFTNPVVTVIGDGTGATIQPQITGNQVVGLIIVNPGFGYTKALVQFSGGNHGASATAALFPFGISGTAIETAFSRVWITNGGALSSGFSNDPPVNRTLFSAAGDPANFNPSAGAGAFLSNDAFLRVGYHALRQTNGFLYLIGDSSINYISGITTSSSGTPPVVTTSFTNANADPQVGTPWPSSIQVFKRNIVLANSAGVMVSYGGAVTKISDALDGIYGSVPINGGSQNFSSAIADLYGLLRVYMLLLPIIDPITGQQVNKLLIWDEKKWTTASQSDTLNYIASQELNSVITAWGSDGFNIFQLFQQPGSLTKTFQTKLWAAPGYYFTKQMLRILGVTKNFGSAQAQLSITADNEAGPGPANAVTVPLQSFTWFNGSAVVLWFNGAAPFIWGGLFNFNVFGPVPLGNSGRLLGLTVSTPATDMALLSMTMIEQTFESNI